MIYEKIRELCKKHRINISVLESELNFGNGTISKWKKSNPKFSSIAAIAKYFNVSLDYFADDKDKQYFEEKSKTIYLIIIQL